MTTVPNGVLGGAVAGLVATVAVRFVVGAPSAPQATGAAPSRPRRLAAGLLYGGAAGGLLVAGDLYLLGTLGVPPTAGEALALAVVGSGVLLVAAGAVRLLAPASPAGRLRPVELLAYHAVYGLALAVWLRATWLT